MIREPNFSVATVTFKFSFPLFDLKYLKAEKENHLLLYTAR